MTHTSFPSVPETPLEKGVIVAAFYKFIHLSDPISVRRDLQKACESAGILGTILIAHEGINGTVCASREGICALMAHFAERPCFSDIQPKYSFAEEPAFYRMKVRLKREIVTMGQPDIDPENSVGTYVSPQDWNALISAPDTLVIDTRNHYEVAIGTFENAVNPETASFREFPAWIENYMADLPEEKRPKNIAMCCTGGIRCEQATS
ncbi:MAG: hypothetical protein VX315_04875 [Pseudomonadota bacterium]|nr:hypothetical protein [Pseudomonadota bacterium]